MNTEDFLRRVVPPGNFLAVSYNFVPRTGLPADGKKPFANRFYAYNDIGLAARSLTFQASKLGNDAYFALASFKAATPVPGNQHGAHTGQRKHNNVQNLKAFWIDLDVFRPGDRKKPGAAWATRLDAKQWLVGFCKATNTPPPNLLVDSGYGYHAYWVLETPMPKITWQPYADALYAMLVNHGFLGDPGISNDSARILRPHHTYNMKSGTPVLVRALEKHTLATDYPNQIVLAALQPFVGVATVSAVAGATVAVAASATAQALSAGGNVSSIFTGGTVSSFNMNAAAQVGVQLARPSYFAAIAEQCAQVATSLVEHGVNDGRDVWYKGHLTLAAFCVDGADFVHPISDGWNGYNPAEVDREFKRAQSEHADPNSKFGPMHCVTYDKLRANICPQCPHFNKITTPWTLGTKIDAADLPLGFRRNDTSTYIEASEFDQKDRERWRPILRGDVGEPQATHNDPGGYGIVFNYYHDGQVTKVYAATDILPTESGKVFHYFQQFDIILMPGDEIPWRKFVLAWINQLRAARTVNPTSAQPFGWAMKDTKRIGFAVNGTLYRDDGTVESVTPPDAQYAREYHPSGTLEAWQRAANFLMKDRPDLQMIIAVAFGAPLMTFTGQPGVLFNVWSQQSGAGKTSAMRVGCSVWAGATAMSALKDTNNSVEKRIGATRNMPGWWDEMRSSDAEHMKAAVDLLMSLTQGKGKSRLTADSRQQMVDTWETILMCASNYPIMEHVLAGTAGTDAGAVRLFEWNITLPQADADNEASRIISLANLNYGHAGVRYAQWIAQNVDKVEQVVIKCTDEFHSRLTPDHSERFLIAGMTVCNVGAQIANKLGLCQFDIPLLRSFMEGNFNRLRDARDTNVTTSSKGVDLEDLFSQFVAAHAKYKLVTDRFAVPGAQTTKPQILWVPPERGKVTIHASQHDRAIHVDLADFNRWCRETGQVAPVLLSNMTNKWGATHGHGIRKNLGGGTLYGSGHKRAIVIPVSTAYLAEFLQGAGTTQSTTPYTAPTPTTPGNQPKV